MKKKPSEKRALKLEPAVDVDEGFTIEFASLLKHEPRLYHLAVREAEALAFQTPFPQLVLPALLEEKLGQAARWTDRQRSLIMSEDESAFAA